MKSMLTIEKLKDYGADIDEALTRCMGKEDFYIMLCGMVKDDKNFEGLKTALAENDLKKGFEAAHALKGVVSNLALKPLLEPVVEITELLRSGTEMDYTELLDRIEKEKNRFLDLFN